MDRDQVPLSSLVGERGIKTTKDFADFMGALMADLVANRVDSQQANAACLAGDKILKLAQMQLDHARFSGNDKLRLGRADTLLVSDNPEKATGE